jgi:GT2 family glycosyltransferase
MRPPEISVIIISRNEGDYLRRTLDGLEQTLPPDTEIVVVDDGSVDGSTEFLHSQSRIRLIPGGNLGVAKARNLGAKQTTGKTLLFVDAHMEFPADWWQPLSEALLRPGAGAAAPAVAHIGNAELKGFGLNLSGPDLDARWLPQLQTDPYHVPIVPGACVAMSRQVFEDAGAFDDGLISRGGVDNELSIRLWLLGYELYVVPCVEVRHLFRRRAPFPVAWTPLLHNRLRLAFVHFNRKRVRCVIETLQEHEHFAAAVSLAIEGDISSRRAQLRSRRVRTDDWYFERFDLCW